MHSQIALIPWQQNHVTEPYAGTFNEQTCHDSLSQFGISFVLCLYDDIANEWPSMLRTAASQHTRKQVLLVLQPCEFLRNPFIATPLEKVTIFTQNGKVMATIMPVDFVKKAYDHIKNLTGFLNIIRANNLMVEGDADVLRTLP